MQDKARARRVDSFAAVMSEVWSVFECNKITKIQILYAFQKKKDSNSVIGLKNEDMETHKRRI